MRTITIEIGGVYGFDVVDWYGRRANGLGFDEMLGQVVSLCHPKLGEPQFRMLTSDEWAEFESQRAARVIAAQSPANDPPFPF